MNQANFDTTMWLVSLIVASLSFGFWQHSVGAGLFLFFATIVVLFFRSRG